MNPRHSESAGRQRRAPPGADTARRGRRSGRKAQAGFARAGLFGHRKRACSSPSAPARKNAAHSGGVFSDIDEVNPRHSESAGQHRRAPPGAERLCKKPLYKRRLPCYSSRNAWAAPGKERIMLSFRLAFSAAEKEQGLVRSIYPDGAAVRADKAEDGVGMIR